MVMQVLGRVRVLKSCDVFAAVAAAEIEDAFLQVIVFYIVILHNVQILCGNMLIIYYRIVEMPVR